ncbi:hypothetical protein ACFFKE_27975 [Streptomyces mutabilis]|uniref:hypothetical protein n=1 Tax=Streptomyces mutabilis TaxID=67332 RepID=UPI001784427B|nr:hypothetical protein [Streptomyces mutabilis]GGQ46379.1 hypothetical protein GCM10010279_65030 [Streptomyces mutabilis]
MPDRIGPQHTGDCAPDVRQALARAAGRKAPGPAPVQAILDGARARRSRRTAVTAAAGVLVAGVTAAVVLPLLNGPPQDDGPRPAASSPSVPPVPDAPETTERSQVVRSGDIDGKEWSVTLTFHPDVPDDFPSADTAVGDTADRDADEGFGGASRPGDLSLLCQRVFIGGVQVDHQAGPWAGCSVVDGEADSDQGAGLHSLSEKGLSGTRIFVGNPAPGTVTARLTLDGGAVRMAQVVTLPGTSYRAFALPVADGETIASVDTFDGQGNRLTHETYWD